MNKMNKINKYYILMHVYNANHITYSKHSFFQHIRRL